MKKSYILAASLAMMVAVSSCSNDEGDSVSSSTSDRFGEQSIGVILSTSKAISNTLEDLQKDGDGIPIYAVTSDDANGFFIKGDATKYDSETGYWEWSGTTTYSWPTSTDKYSMSFYSYYPLDDDIWNIAMVEGDDTGTDRSLTALITIGEPDTQSDLLSTVSETDVRPVSGLLPLTFDHILSRVYLNLAAADGVKLYVQELTMCDVAATNSYDVMNQSWTSIASTSGSTSYTYTDFANPAMVVTTDSEDLSDGEVEYTASTDNLMILPQTIIAWDLKSTVKDARVELIYRTTLVSTSGDQIGYTRADSHPNYVAGKTETSASSPLFVKIAVPVTAPKITDDMNENQWYDGYEYTYNLTLGGYNSNNGYLADDYYYDEKGNKTDLEVLGSDIGDEVTPGDICFDVKISDWGTASSTTL